MISMEPACWSWSLPTEPLGVRPPGQWAAQLSDEGLALDALHQWHAGRCALCGEDWGGDLIEDHDHLTGFIRGYLCRPCNTREGIHRRDARGVWHDYRQRNPASILGVRAVYINRVTGLPAQPVRAVDKWTDNPMRGVGL